MEKPMGPRRGNEKRKLIRKVVAAAALVVIFACVVFSIPSERLAWQAPYVMGTLLLPKPSPAPYIRSETQKENADSSFSLLAFFAVAGILVLAIRKTPDFPGGRGGIQPDHGLRFSTEENITIMYIL